MSALSRIRHDHREAGASHCQEFSVCQQSSEPASSLRNILPSHGGIPEIICIRFITTLFSQIIIEHGTVQKQLYSFTVLPFILNLMSIKNLTLFLILSSKLIPANINTKMTLNYSSKSHFEEVGTLSRQFIVNSHGGIKAAAFLTEMIRMVFLTTFCAA